jgi:hypothetical protein
VNRRTFLKGAVSLACVGASELVVGSQSKAPAHKSKSVRLGSDGMLTIDGRREFIQGLYMLPNRPDPWNEAQEAGFNLIHTNASRTDLAKAHEHGLYAWATLGSISASKRSEAQKRIRDIVMLLKDEPSLLCWETEDEPTFVWKKNEARVPAQEIIETARFIRSIDPSHLIYLNHSPTNLISTLRAYNPGADIVATDIYPVIPSGIREMYALWPDGQQGDLLNSYISQVGQYVDKMREVAGPRRAVFMVLQAFAWENLREKDRDSKLILYPTRHQLRFMAWQAVVHGVNGLLWWGLSFTPSDAPLWNDLKSVTQELKQLESCLSARKSSFSPKLVYHDTGHSIDRGIEWTSRPAEKGVLLIAVNADRNPVDVTFEGLEKFQKREVLFETRSLKNEAKSFRDYFEPFDTRIYRLS